MTQHKWPINVCNITKNVKNITPLLQYTIGYDMTAFTFDKLHTPRTTTRTLGSMIVIVHEQLIVQTRKKDKLKEDELLILIGQTALFTSL